uniref:Uncharacterized protein n=1 Tax=Chrysolophus pictus TaxID=9089 RepID=A0A8C3LZR8_CHRPC
MLLFGSLQNWTAVVRGLIASASPHYNMGFNEGLIRYASASESGISFSFGINCFCVCTFKCSQSTCMQGLCLIKNSSCASGKKGPSAAILGVLLCEGRRKHGASVLRSCETQRCRTAFNNNVLRTPCAYCAPPSAVTAALRPPHRQGALGRPRPTALPAGAAGSWSPGRTEAAGSGAAMRRVSSSVCSDEVLLEELETEGERQLKSLLQQQLDTSASIERCKSKRRCFAPAAFYRPFGEAAAGALSLSQFRELQESDKETAALRELGLSEPEIALWKNRAAGKHSGLGAAPEAVQERLNAIQEKMEE